MKLRVLRFQSPSVDVVYVNALINYDLGDRSLFALLSYRWFWNNVISFGISENLLCLDGAGVVSCGVTKESLRTSSIVQIIFYFLSFEINGNILRTQYLV